MSFNHMISCLCVVCAFTGLYVSAGSQDPARSPVPDVAALRKEVATLRGALEEYAADGERRGEAINRMSLFDPPIGSVMAFSGEWPPRKGADTERWTEDKVGWVLCDGRKLGGDRFAALRQVLGAAELPDLAGRMLVVAGKGAELTERLPGQRGGHETHTLTVQQMPKHKHEVNDPGHLTPGMPGNAGNIYDSGKKRQAASFFNNPRDTRAFTDISIEPAGGSQPFGIMPPYVAVHHIIKFR